ncbi:MAG: IS1096 element passenger TnpR family protein, partial [Rhodoplanes sp.]
MPTCWPGSPTIRSPTSPRCSPGTGAARSRSRAPPDVTAQSPPKPPSLRPLSEGYSELAEVIEDVGTKTLRYIYDFGDGWEHTIKIERLGDPEPGVTYPRLIEASGRCP